MISRTKSIRPHRSTRPRRSATPRATFASIESALRDRRDQLLRRVGMIEGDLRSVCDRDSQERAGELENDDVLEQLDALSLAELRQIDAALQRIANGTYGSCVNCGRVIASNRLSAVPTAATCVACAPGERS